MTNQICEPTSSLIIANEHSKSGLKALLEAGISFTVDTIRATLKNQRTYRTNRAAFRQMLKLEDNILQDIGVTRDDIVWASFCRLVRMRRWNSIQSQPHAVAHEEGIKNSQGF